MTDEKTRALIAEAAECSAREREALGADAYVGGLLTRLVDELKALLPVPDGDARERIARALCERNGYLWDDTEEDQQAFHLGDADAILAAVPALSRDIAGEIEAEIGKYTEASKLGSGYYAGLRHAAEIVRNGR